MNSVRVSKESLQLIGHYDKKYRWVGGGIADKVNRTYGRWEIRFRADAGVGFAPVVLLWPQGKWPDNGAWESNRLNKITACFIHATRGCRLPACGCG